MVSDEITMNRNFIHHLYQTAELFNDEDQYKPYQPLQKQGEKVKEFGKKYPKTYTGMAELVNKLDDEYRYTWYSKNNVFDGMISKMSSDKSFNRHIWNDWMWQVFIGRYELEKDNDLPADELD